MKTRFVKSPDEVRRLQQAYAAPAFLDMRTLAVTFETDPAVVAGLLPPPLAPAAEPRVTVSISEITRSNCVGPFNAAAVNIACRFDGQAGVYCIAMPMSTDTAVIFGRELYAEPKKLAEIELEQRPGGHVRGTVTRRGITVIEIRAQFEDGFREANVERQSRNYYFKYLPSADGLGFAHDPELIEVTHRSVVYRVVSGSGTLTFRESCHDPLIDIPVLSITGVTLSEGDLHTTARVAATVDPAAFMPYAFAKVDDLTVWAETPASVTV
jgi:acetoacetate decarboxylase